MELRYNYSMQTVVCLTHSYPLPIATIRRARFLFIVLPDNQNFIVQMPA